MVSGPKNRTPLTKEKAKKAGAASQRLTRNRPNSATAGLEQLSRAKVRLLVAGATVLTVALVGSLAWYFVPKFQDKAEKDKFTPSTSNRDPSLAIPGIHTSTYQPALHVTAKQRVAYDRTPPIGGPHDPIGAACSGVVYPNPVRNENVVSALEHGAVWIAYNPDKLSAGGVAQLQKRVTGQHYLLMSPYPGMGSPISLQAWGHQLTTDDASDKRIDQFITALRRNSYLLPVQGGNCAGPAFSPTSPPPFDNSPLPPNAVPIDGGGIKPDQDEIRGTVALPKVPAEATTTGKFVPPTVVPKNPAPNSAPVKSTFGAHPQHGVR